MKLTSKKIMVRRHSFAPFATQRCAKIVNIVEAVTNVLMVLIIIAGG